MLSIARTLAWSLAVIGASAQTPFPNFTGNPFVKYNISAPGINASFIPYGARLTNLFVNDNCGSPQDVVLGYDTGEQYLNDTETIHSYFGAVVGRYANRIKNGTFTIDGVTSHIPENEHNGETTLHGGFIGYDQQNWTVVSWQNDSITFAFYDAAQSGFPGDVMNYATYTVGASEEGRPMWTSRLVTVPLNDPTPIMLANHVYWNLGASVNQEAQSVLNDTLHMPYGTRIIDFDGIEVPTGPINITKDTPYDFLTPTKIGARINETINGCGTGCTGYDNAFILDRPRYAAREDPHLTVLTMSSPETGIRMDLKTNQGSLQIYTCDGLEDVVAKSDQQHGNETTYYGKYKCIVIETQQWIDGINNPQWGQDRYQIYRVTTEPAINMATYEFSTMSSMSA